MIIDEGKFDKKNIALCNKTERYFLDVLKNKGCKSEKSVLVMTVDGNGKVYLQQRGKPYQVFDLKWEEKMW